MALRFEDPNEEYPYIFMVSQSIEQRVPVHQSDSPEYTLSLILRFYKLEQDGTIAFKPDTQLSYYDDNFYTTAMVDYSNSITTHANTLGAQKVSIQHIVELETSKTVVDI